MLTPLVTSKHIEKAYVLYKNLLTANTIKKSGTISFSTNDVPAVSDKVNWNSKHKFWSYFGKDEYGGGNRHWCPFGIDDPAGKQIDITTEINIPLEGINRRVGAYFAKDKQEKLYLMHSGKIGGGRRGIGKKAFKQFYSKRCRTVEVQWPDGKVTDDYPVAVVPSNDFELEVANFIHAVAEFKKTVKAKAI